MSRLTQKLLLPIILGSLAAALYGCRSSSEEAELSPASAIITYRVEVTAGGMAREPLLARKYIDFRSNRWRRDEIGISEGQERVFASKIFDGRHKYLLIQGLKTAMPIPMPGRAGRKSAGDSLLEHSGQPKEKAVVAGQSCYVYVAEGVQECVWNGFVLETVTKAPNLQTREYAQDIRVDVALEPDMFDVPVDFTIQPE